MRPRLLDLFCGAGGAAMGYHRAGFEVVGVDIKPQPHYPFEFHQGDAMTWPLDDFNAIHASPPCEGYSQAQHIWASGNRHPRLIEQVRERLRGRLYVIENVPGAPLIAPTTLCGRAFNLNVKRHRWFESSFSVTLAPQCPKGHPGDWLVIYGGGVRTRAPQTGTAKGGGPVIHRGTRPLLEGLAAMGIDWMNRHELSEAIPPAYTQFIGEVMLKHV